MTVQQSRVLPLTDSNARSLVPSNEGEPEPGSVVLINGEFGCAWQRQFDDGLWRSVRGGKPKPWDWLMLRRNLVLVYDAAVRS